ncbi:zinc-dependent metalloprotease [Hyphomonas sp. WL0036]|uniref:zinc-dependent metalloprotease n=1 Tax=Hyphomonas sediminis TaxID=2866160 RepID=UPI001C7F39B8|nr:zinc-dependent metalloprotease [Hyphomonas sediminis]MBY9065597.1 zinc-dependent metalloprotease [Hyphomonas sediminis]
MRFAILLTAVCLGLSGAAVSQPKTEAPPTLAQKIDGLEALPGFLDLYVDQSKGKVYVALPAPDADGISARFIYAAGLTAGLGSNPIGLDRGNSSSGDIIRFRRIGEKVVAEAENWNYRATSGRADEERSVQQSFANSFLWSTGIEATGADGRLLIDLSGFLTRDANDIARALKHGKDASDYRLVADRSMPDPENVLSFPDNAEIDAFLTFETSKPNSETYATAADARAITLVLHHSFVRLPDDGYTPRAFDQRTASIGMGFHDFSAPLDAPLISRFSPRMRLERVDAAAASGPVKEPIVFYVDNGAPAEIRNALIEGASWWAEGFAAAGFENAYRVEVLPEGAHPLDVRYNVINWVHRQTRGWSYGGSVVDPRTGEILKANVILGSQRVRQDRMIFEGLAGAAKSGSGEAGDPVEISLARIRQLSAHEVGHTLGFAHNFAASTNDRASVMDYPAPWVKPAAGGLDFSEAYATGLGAWDIFTVKWLYSQFPEGGDDPAKLNQMVDAAYGSGLRFVSDGHARNKETGHPFGAVWDNGADPVAMLDEVMEVRRIALANFGPGALADGRPLSDLNAVIVPIYLYHRYQIEAAAKSIGGLDFRYQMKGEGETPAVPVAPAEQRRALEALARTLNPAALDLPDTALNYLTPGDLGYFGRGSIDELFPNRTGPVFDLAASAEVAADLTLSAVLDPKRANRLMAYEQRNPNTLTLADVIERLETAAFARTDSPRLAALSQIVQTRFVAELISLSRSETASSSVKAVTDSYLSGLQSRLSVSKRGQTVTDPVTSRALADLIGKHLAGDELPGAILRPAPATPAGAPIGSFSGAMGQTEECWHCTGE